MADLILKDFRFPPLNNHNYVVLEHQSKEAVLFDCSIANDDVVKFIEEQGAFLKMILLTHGHFDHVMGVNYFWEKYHIPTYVHENDLSLLQDINSYTRYANMTEKVDIPKVDGTFNGNTIFKLGNYPIRILETPGHTQGGACFLIDDILITYLQIDEMVFLSTILILMVIIVGHLLYILLKKEKILRNRKSCRDKGYAIVQVSVSDPAVPTAVTSMEYP